MLTHSHTEQNQFEELQVVDFEYTDELYSNNNVVAICTIEIDVLLNLLVRQMRRTDVTTNLSDLASTADGNTTSLDTEMPPPSRYTRRSRAAGPGSFAN